MKSFCKTAVFIATAGLIWGLVFFLLLHNSSAPLPVALVYAAIPLVSALFCAQVVLVIGRQVQIIETQDAAWSVSWDILPIALWPVFAAGVGYLRPMDDMQWGLPIWGAGLLIASAFWILRRVIHPWRFPSVNSWQVVLSLSFGPYVVASIVFAHHSGMFLLNTVLATIAAYMAVAALGFLSVLRKHYLALLE
jgi:hypothetical protein